MYIKLQLLMKMLMIRHLNIYCIYCDDFTSVLKLRRITKLEEVLKYDFVVAVL